MTNEMRVYLNNVDLDPLTTIVNGVETDVVLYPSDMENPWIFERINGEYTFAFVIRDEGLGKIIRNDHVVFVDDDYFIIVGEDILHGEAYEKKYTCEHYSYKLNFHDADSDELETEITYTGTVYGIIPQMLAGTNFNYTLSDDTPGNFTFTTKKRGIRARIIEFCTQCGFEANFYRFSVTLQVRRGYADGPEIRFGKNIRRLRESRILNFDKTEDVNFDLDYVDLNYVTDLDGNMLSDNDLHMGDTVYIYTTLDEDEVPVVKRAVAVGYNPFEHALPTVELSDNLIARDLAQQMLKKDSGGGSGGLAINGTNDMLVVYKSDIAQGDLVTVRRSFDIGTPLKLENPTTLPTGQGNGVTFSNDGNYMVVAHATTPYISIYKRNNDVFTKLPNPSSLPPSTVNDVAFSNDGIYLAVVHDSSPFVSIYKRNGDTFTKLSNPLTLPTGVGRGVSFSDGGNYLAIGHTTAPNLTVYKRDGDSFVKLPNPPSLPNSTCYSVDFSNDSIYLAVGCSTSPGIVIYKRDVDTFTRLPNPSYLPTGGSRGVKFSNDGNYLAVAQEYNTPYLVIYKREGDAFDKLPDPNSLPLGFGRSVSFSADSNYLAVAHLTSPFVTFYKRSGDAFAKINNPAILPTGQGNGVDMGSTQPYIAVAHANSPYVTIYKTDVAGDYAYAYNGPTDIYRENFYSVAVAMEDGQTNDVSKRVTTIPIA